MSLSHAALAFQREVYAVLYQDPLLQTMVRGVYDFVPEQSILPYISLSVLQMRDASSRFCDISEVTANITIWSDYHGKQETLEIAEQIETLMHREMLHPAGGSLLSLRHISQIHDVVRDQQLRRGRLRYLARIEEDVL